MLNGRRFVTAALALVLVLCAFVLGGCSQKAAESCPPAESDLTLIIMADGQICVVSSEDAGSIADALAKSGIVLNDGDMLSVRPNQLLASGMVVEVLRRTTVTIALEANGVSADYTVTLVGATVADALRAVGINPADILDANFDLNTPLTPGMAIEVSSMVAPAVVGGEGADGDADADDDDSYSGGGGGGWSGGGSAGGSDEPSGPTVVSVERYDDCDGSGHGVMVITYSDGTQEERVY